MTTNSKARASAGITLLAAALFIAGCGSQSGTTPGQGPDDSGPTRDAAAGRTVVIAAAGDIACRPGSSKFNDGKGIGSNCRQLYTADAASSVNPDAVLALGDNQYDNGALTDFEGSFKKSWGRFLNITDPAANQLWPTPGNHEYGDGRAGFENAPGYWASFNGGTEANPNPAGIAGTTHEGWYSKDIGSWHVIALNSECVGKYNPKITVECKQGSPQYEWLKKDLADNAAKCTIAYWHRPLFTVGKHSGFEDVEPFWDLLSAAKVEVVLNGHNHSYERFAPMDPSGNPSAGGIRQFVVGMGGKNFYPMRPEKSPVKAVVANNDTMGVLKMTLGPTGYQWEYIRAPYDGNGTFTDAGTGVCT